MDEKDIKKQLNSEVKPGTESLAINEAQSTANQLLTEQRMNLETERQTSSINQSRDLELKGALELGAMSNAQAPQQVTLPPQAAGLRPETQKILTNYGVNPQIFENSRSTSNTTSNRSTSRSSQSMPNPSGGQTRVTNTTNITNITNNNTNTETKIEGDGLVRPQQAVAPIPVRSQQPSDGGFSKFKVYMDNVFSKRNQEKIIQEREFRKRDWNLKRTTDKILNRMKDISTTFARKMNPENVGRTFMSQFKLLLTLAGFSLIPKLYPLMIKGVDSISDGINYLKNAFSGEGTFTQKLGKIFTDAISGISTSLGRFIGGKDWKDGMGLADVIGDKISVAIGGRNDDGSITNLGDRINQVFSDLKGQLSEVMSEMAADRANAIKDIWDKNWGNAKLGISDIPRVLTDIIGAAVGGSSYMASSEFSKAQDEASEKLNEGLSVTKGDINAFSGVPKNSLSAEQMARNLGNAARDKNNTNTVTILEGLKKLYKYGVGDNNKNGTLSLSKSDIESILSRVYGNDSAQINRVISAIKEVSLKDKNGNPEVLDYKSGSELYLIPKDKIPAVISMLSGLNLKSFDYNLAKSDMDRFYKNKNQYMSHAVNVDKNAVTQMRGSYSLDNLNTNVENWILSPFYGNNLDAQYLPFYVTPNDKSQLKEYNRWTDINKEYVERNSEAVDKIGSGEVATAMDALKDTGEDIKVGASQAALNTMNSAKRLVNDTVDSLGLPGSMKFDTDDNSKKNTEIKIPYKIDLNSNSDKSSSGNVSDNGKFIYDYLINQGFTPEQASGIAGVMYAESRFDPTAENSRSTAKGLCQWLRGRWNADDSNYGILKWYKEKTGNNNPDLKVTDIPLKDQLDFVMHELVNVRPKTLELLKASRTPEQAAEVFFRGYENGWNGLSSISKMRDTYNDPYHGGYDKMLRDRVLYSNHLYSKFTGKSLPLNISSSSLDHSLASSNKVSESSTSDGLWSKGIELVDSMLAPEEITKYSSPDLIEADLGSVSANSNNVTTWSKMSSSKLETARENLFTEETEDNLEAANENSGDVYAINSGGNSSISNSNNTTVINYVINDPKNSFIEMKGRSYRRV